MASDGGQRSPATDVLRVKLSVGSTLLVIAAVVAAVATLALLQAVRRPLAWVMAAAIVAWLLSWVIGLLDRWMPRMLAVLSTLLGFAVLVLGSWVAVRATIESGVDTLQDSLLKAAGSLEARYDVAADFRLAERAQSFVDRLQERVGAETEVAATAGTFSTYLVGGILMLFLVAYGPRFVSAALEQITDRSRREYLSALLSLSSRRARAYLLVAIVQALAVTAIGTGIFTLLGLPAPFVLALIVGWLSAIPYLGIVLGGLAPLLAAAAEPQLLTYAVLLLVICGLQVIEALVVRPRVDRRILRVGPTVMLVGTLVGFELYGFGGAVFGAALLVLLWSVLQSRPDVSAGPSLDAGTPAPDG